MALGHDRVQFTFVGLLLRFGISANCSWADPGAKRRKLYKHFSLSVTCSFSFSLSLSLFLSLSLSSCFFSLLFFSFSLYFSHRSLITPFLNKNHEVQKATQSTYKYFKYYNFTGKKQAIIRCHVSPLVYPIWGTAFQNSTHQDGTLASHWGLPINYPLNRRAQKPQ
jgi:hypothetical protein